MEKAMISIKNTDDGIEAKIEGSGLDLLALYSELTSSLIKMFNDDASVRFAFKLGSEDSKKEGIS